MTPPSIVPAAIVPALIFAVSNGVSEEVAYRGVLLHWSARVMGAGPVWGVVGGWRRQFTGSWDQIAGPNWAEYRLRHDPVAAVFLPFPPIHQQ